MQVIVASSHCRWRNDEMKMVMGKDGEALYKKTIVVDSCGREGEIVEIIDENDDGHGKIKVHIKNENIDYVTDFEPSENWNKKNQLYIKELVQTIRQNLIK